MKKLLFTLCAVLAVFAASAENILVFQYVDDQGNALENNEIIMKPGTEATVHMKVTEIPDVCVQGFSWNFFVKNQAGDKTGITGDVQLKNLGSAFQKKYYQAEELGTFPEATIASSTPTLNDGSIPYRIIATNTAMGLVFGNSAGIAAKTGMTVAEVEANLDPEQYTIPGKVFYFTITTSADWAEEYATLDLWVDESKISWGDNSSNYFADMDIKILNEDKLPPELEDLTGTVTFTVDEETGKVSVNYSGDEEVNITVKLGDEVVTMPYQLEDGADPITLTYEVTADGYKPLTGESQELSWTAPVVPVAPDKPVIEITGQETAQMTITVTNVTEGATLYVNGQAVEGNSYTYTVDRTDIYTEAPDVTVTAKAVKDGLESETATATGVWVVATQPTADEPVIEFVETKNDKNEVAKVEVVVTKATSYKVFVDGEELRGEVINANYTATQAIHVEAENDPGYPYVKAENEADYTLNKLTKNTVAAPEVTPTTGDDAVTLNITWPESDGTHVIKVDGQESTETSFPRQDEDYNVTLDIYVTEGPTCAESAHYTQTITIPAKPQQPTPQTGAPTFHETLKPNTNAIFITIENAPTEQGATIYYQITYPDGSKSGWLEYEGEFAITGTNGGGADGQYTVEAYAVAPGKTASEIIKLERTLGPETGIAELVDGKAIANVRYFNMAGQQMQEANGMTIVVTTYTDGTTSAVKVMK